MSDSDNIIHKGQCFCGTVQVEATGAPFAMGYCHCSDCRAWAAAPVNAFTLWKPDEVNITAGADSIGTHKKTENSHRQYCIKCGGHVLTDHPGGEFVDIYSAILPSLEFKPGLHVHYAESVLSIKDGLPKLKDMPAEFGGSGETIEE